MQALFLIVFNSIFPVFFIIGLGYYLFKIEFISKDLQSGLNKLAYWTGLPCFLFYKVAFAKLQTETAGKLLVSMVSATILAMIIAYFLAKVFKAPKSTAGTCIQASGRGNLAFIALPIIIFMVNKLAPERADEIIDSVILTLTPVVIMYNLVCVTFLVSHSTQVSDNLKKDIAKGLFTNPLIIACTLGLVYNFSSLEIKPDNAFFRICETIGQSAFPMALLGVGSQLAQISLKGNIRWVTTFAFIKTVLAPTLGFLISRMLNMDNLETLSLMLMLASPTAIAAYVLADQLKCDPDITASTIMLSTIFSFFTFSVILILFSGVI